MLNAMIPHANMQTGAISEKTKRGRHTTRHVELFEVEGGGKVFDTPGFTSFEIMEAGEDNLRLYYPEIERYEGQCRYDNCRHITEPDCAVREAVKNGEAVVNCKSKTRVIFIVKELRKKLLRYAAEQNIKTGMIFITKAGKPINRTNIWREMKSLCKAANVNPQKVFPHNLRHLFARVFYGIEKDIAKLADILGHSSINTTRIYIISTGTEHRRRMENMHLIL